MDPVDGDQVYAAERLLQQRTRRGKSEYLVKWKGWSAKHNTWEPVDNILDERLIQEFNDNQPEKSTSGTKRKAAQSKEPASAPAKRGRRARNTKADSTSDNTSPTTSIGTRRSSRSVASVTEQQKQQQQLSEDSEVSEKPSQNTSEDSDTPAEFEDVESEVETVKKKKVTPTKAEKTTAQAEDEKEEEGGNNAERSSKLFESSAEDSSLTDDAADSAEEPVAKDISTSIPNQEAHPEQPVEIYVERSVKITTETITGENGSNADSNQDAYVITTKEDPSCTHKIQVFTVPSTSINKEITGHQEKTAEEAEKNTNEVDEDDAEERFEIVKESSTYGADNGTGNNNGSFLDTVGEDRSSSKNEQHDESTNPPQTKNDIERSSTESTSFFSE